MTSSRAEVAGNTVLTDDDIRELIGGTGVLIDDIDPRPWLIDGFVHPGITCISGQHTQGKTTLVLSMLRSLLDGSPWLGQRLGSSETNEC